jgi:hypothetical protein
MRWFDAPHQPVAIVVSHSAPSNGIGRPGPSPTRMVATTRLLDGSMRETVPSPWLATHTTP